MKENNQQFMGRVKFVDNKYRDAKKAIGYCRYAYHPGFVSTKILNKREKKCLKCIHFEKIATHPYMQQIEKKNAEKELRKTRKANEKEIMQFAQSVLPSYINVILCKHLYDTTFILIIQSSKIISNNELSKEIYEKFNLHVYVRVINEKYLNNIEYTYLTFLPDEMKYRLRKYKAKK